MASASCKLGLFLYLGEREIKKAVNLLYSQLFFVGLPALYHSAIFGFRISLISRSVYSHATELATEFNYIP